MTSWCSVQMYRFRLPLVFAFSVSNLSRTFGDLYALQWKVTWHRQMHPKIIKIGRQRLVDVLYTPDTWKNLDVPANRKDTQLITIFKKEER